MPTAFVNRSEIDLALVDPKSMPTAFVNRWPRRSLRVSVEVNAFLQRCARGEERLLSCKVRGYHNPLIKLLILSKYGLLQVKNNWMWHLGIAVLALLVAIPLATVYTNQDSNGQSGMQNRTGPIRNRRTHGVR